MSYHILINGSRIGKNVAGGSGKDGILGLIGSGLIGDALYGFTTFTFGIGNVWSYLPNVLADFVNYAPYSNQDGFDDTDNFDISSGKQKWTVPTNGNYSFEAAAGGGGTIHQQSYAGGRGVKATWDIDLEKGDVVEILVGSAGGRYQYTAGGGGATYVKFPDDTIPAVICGGGGGAGNSGGAADDGSTGTSGSGGRGGTNGTNGSHGNGGGGWGTGGNGWASRDTGSSMNPGASNWTGSQYGQTLANDARGVSHTHGSFGMSSASTGSCYGAPGGYGGGGGGQCNGGGVGGGYSGGRGGGAGGGSYVDTTNGVTNHSWASGSSGNPDDTHGYVIVTLN